MIKKLSLIVCVFLFHSAMAQPAKKHREYSDHFFRSTRYGFFKPDNYDPSKSYPLVLYLHGASDTVSRDNFWYQDAIQKDNPVFVVTPKCLSIDQGWGNTWTNQHTEPVVNALALIDSLTKVYNIDVNRLYLYGISMGGFGTFSILQKNPGKFAAAYVICGGGSEKSVSNMLQTPLWIFHGSDDDVVSIVYARQVYDEIRRQGGTTVRFTEYAGVKHNSWENAIREKTLAKWVLSQKKQSSSRNPPRVTGIKIEPANDDTRIRWQAPDADNRVWYYKVFRDNKLLAEIDGDAYEYTDRTGNSKNIYRIAAVNYFFKESE